MPTYPYYCKLCDHEFDIVKRIKDIDRPELCDQCFQESSRRIAKPNLVAIHDWTETYNPGLGQVVKNKAHQREILAKMRDNGKEMIEIGNEPLENIHRSCDKIREDRRIERWSEPTEKIRQEVLG